MTENSGAQGGTSACKVSRRQVLPCVWNAVTTALDTLVEEQEPVKDADRQSDSPGQQQAGRSGSDYREWSGDRPESVTSEQMSRQKPNPGTSQESVQAAFSQRQDQVGNRRTTGMDNRNIGNAV